MRKIMAAGMAALTLGGALAATATPAEAQRRYYRDYDRHRGDRTGAAVAAGVVGLALGAAIAGSNNNRGYYNNGYYGGAYYDGRGYYDGGYYGRPRICETSRWVYDPYIGRRVMVRDRYRC